MTLPKRTKAAREKLDEIHCKVQGKPKKKKTETSQMSLHSQLRIMENETAQLYKEYAEHRDMLRFDKLDRITKPLVGEFETLRRRLDGGEGHSPRLRFAADKLEAAAREMREFAESMEAEENRSRRELLEYTDSMKKKRK